VFAPRIFTGKSNICEYGRAYLPRVKHLTVSPLIG
jgi:hypothetical protein